MFCSISILSTLPMLKTNYTLFKKHIIIVYIYGHSSWKTARWVWWSYYGLNLMSDTSWPNRREGYDSFLSGYNNSSFITWNKKEPQHKQWWWHSFSKVMSLSYKLVSAKFEFSLQSMAIKHNDLKVCYVFLIYWK